MIQKLHILEEKAPYKSNDTIEVLKFGPSREQFASVYLFDDVLEELVFNAHQRSARGMLLGKLYRYPKVDKACADVDRLKINLDDDSAKNKINGFETRKKISKASDKPEFYLEIQAFKDIYPTDDALDYGTFLRRARDFRANDNEILVLGSVCMTPKQHELVLEDLLFQRTYCANEYQVALFVSADGQDARVFMLDNMVGAFVEVGYHIVCLKNTEESD